MAGRGQFQVIVASEQRASEEDSEPRTWIVRVLVFLSGAQVDVCSTIQNCTVRSDDDNIIIERLGESDCNTIVYSVQEKERRMDLVEPIIKVSVLPQYHPNVTRMYKVDRRLAQLVGRNYLGAPKSAMTNVHDYARAKKLYHQRTIKCDDVLFRIFEKDTLELPSLWKEVRKLLKQVELKAVSMTYKLSNMPKYSRDFIEITADEDLKFYPENWKLESRKSIQKTQSFLPAGKVIDRRRSFKRNKSYEL